MSITVQDQLDEASASGITDVALAMLRDADGNGFGYILAGLIPRTYSRTGLDSSATHIEPEAGAILAITDSAGTTGLVMTTGTAGAGEVKVTYDSEGVATLVFGDGANTAYNVIKQVLPAGLATALATVNG